MISSVVVPLYFEIQSINDGRDGLNRPCNRRKSRDDEKPRHGSGRRGSYRAGEAVQVDGCVVRAL